MKQRALFPSEPPAAPYPGEPPVWVKRLVIVRSADALDEPIRDITFRLGLNVVMVGEDGPGTTPSFGHNVGKTLLVRLIRYCLGDVQYAGANMRARIRDALPDAWVAAVVSVRGADWSVARSLGQARRGWCLQSQDWRQVFHDQSARRPFAEFEEELERLVPPAFAQVQLDKLDRSPGWTDLLGWLVRDQACRYTHHNNWRTPDADSGVAALSLGNANLVTRLTLGLFDPEEARHTQQLEELRAESRTQETEETRLCLAAELMRTSLMAAASLSEDVPDGPLFVEALREQIRQRRESQERLLSDPDNRRPLDRAETALVAARAQADRTTGRVEELDRRRQLVAGQLEAATTTSPTDRALMSCGLTGCLHLLDQGDGLPDPLREQRVRDYREEIGELDRQIAAAHAALDQQEQAVREAVACRGEAGDAYDRTVAGILRTIARFDAASDELTRYETGQARLVAIERHQLAIRDQEREIERQREARAESRARALAGLNAAFEEVTTALLNQASGELVLNLRDGLAPRTDATSGEAFGTAGKVIGFDLACLLAGMLGRGSHPRFLVHDSPREADLHRAIYDNLFRLAHTLESRFPDQPPAFQYIITTTSPPPAELAGSPHRREELHARTTDGRLLRVEF